MGWAAFLASPIYRRRLVENPALAGYRFAQVRAAVGHAGRMVALRQRGLCRRPWHCFFDAAFGLF